VAGPWTRRIAGLGIGQALESIAVVGLDLDLGVQREALDVAAEFARQEERPGIATAAEPLDAGAALFTDGHPTLHRGGAELREQLLVGLELLFGVLGLRKAAATREVAQDASMEARGELDDVLVGERGGPPEGRPLEWARAREPAAPTATGIMPLPACDLLGGHLPAHVSLVARLTTGLPATRRPGRTAGAITRRVRRRRAVGVRGVLPQQLFELRDPPLQVRHALEQRLTPRTLRIRRSFVHPSFASARSCRTQTNTCSYLAARPRIKTKANSLGHPSKIRLSTRERGSTWRRAARR
jgi:hypothetical protein